MAMPSAWAASARWRLISRAAGVPPVMLEIRKGARKERVVNYIDPEKCIQMRTEFFDGEGDPRKVLLVDSASIERDSGLWIPRKMTMKDMRDGTETDLHVEKFEIGVDIPRKTFNQSSLARTR